MGGAKDMTERASTELRRNAMGVPEMVFLVIAFAAPLAASTTNVPMAIGLGNGVGAPGTWLLVGLLLALFSVGYTAMSRHISNAGAFYAYITAGLGRSAGVGAGYVALVAYFASVILIGAFFGFFASAALDSEFGISVSWPVCSMVGLAGVFGLCYLGVQTSVRLLGVLLALETGLLIAIILAVLFNHGPGAYPISSFNPGEVFSGTPGIALAFCFSTFLGFEATAIFSEEARDPKRTVARATYVAIAIIAVLYLAASWSTVAAFGDGAVARAGDDPGSMIFQVAGDNLGAWSLHAFNILIVTSLFAVLIAAHNSASRYLFALSRDGWLPARLGATHPRFRSPHVAAVVQITISAAVVLAYAIAGADPFTQLGATFVGMTTLGIVSLMVVVSLAVVGYFRRGERRATLWTGTIAPIASAVLLTGTLVLIIDNFGLLTGSDSTVIHLLPLVLVVAFIAGLVVAGRRAGEAPELDEVGEEPVLATM
jgi:amino acid transporter